MTRIRRILDPEHAGVLLLLAPLTVLLAVEMALSLRWRMTHDAPILHYIALLVDKYGYAPYRDVLETSLPGSYLFHLAIGCTLGWSDAAFQTVNVTWLAALLGVTAALLWPLGRRVAWAGAVLFGLSYLQLGAEMVLQRDYVVILPVTGAALLAARAPRPARAWHALGVGLLMGLVATIKPQLSIGLPVVLLMMTGSGVPLGWRVYVPRLLRLAALAVAGCLLPVAGAFLWLWRTGGLPAFLDMALSYLPLYLQMTGDHFILTGAARLSYLVRAFRRLGGLGIWLGPAALGLYVALFSAELCAAKRRLVLMLAGLAAAYSLPPLIAGQFWDYHWMPFRYWLLVLSVLTLVPLPRRLPWAQRLLPPLLLLVVVLATFNTIPDFRRQLGGDSPAPPKEGRPDAIVAALRPRLQPDDKVQPLDWTGGSTEALLALQVPIATRYLHDFHFYHHVSHPYIQALRRDFIATLAASPPRFVVEVTAKPIPWGPDTSTEFPELRALLHERYAVVAVGDGFMLYERR